MEKSIAGPPVGHLQQFIGPHDQESIEEDLARLIRVYRSIAEHGFLPEKFEELPTSGYFLLHDEDYRFVSHHGMHRLAALSYLGYSTVQVSLTWRHPPVVDFADLDWWTVERGGLYTKELAEELFRKMFFETGRTKAMNIGLLEQQ